MSNEIQSISPIDASPIARRPLYDSVTVGLAAFLGSPLAGFSFIALNYIRLGNKKAAALSVAGGVALVSLLIALGVWFPNGAVTGAGIGAVLATIRLASSLQGEAIETHRSAGGRIGSRWWAVPAALLSAMAIFGSLIFLPVFSGFGDFTPPGTRLVVGQKDEIFYTGNAKEADAQALAQALKTTGYFSDQGLRVGYAVNPDGTAISFIVGDDSAGDLKNVALFAGVVREVAPSIGGLPINMQVINRSGKVLKEMLLQ